MNAQKVKCAVTAILITAAITVKAQDMGQVYMENAAASQQAYMTSHINGLTLRNVLKGNSSKGESNLTYNPSTRIRDRVIDRMAAGMKLSQANVVRLKQKDFNKIFTEITAPYRLQVDDAADILTAYQVLNWMIANNAPDPTPSSVDAVRRSSIAALKLDRDIAHNAGNRAMLGEELKIIFVLNHSGWQAAKKSGAVSAYSDNITNQYQRRYNQDLRKLKLDSKGLHQ